MNPKAAAKVLAKLHEYGVAPEIVTILESGALAKMLDELGSWDDEARILELAEVRLAAATLGKMSWGGFVLNGMEPEIAAAIIEEMTPRELSETLKFGGSMSPDPLDRVIDNISNERSLYLMSRIGTRRSANLLANMVQRSPGRADELLREMKPGLAGRIFGEVDLDAALGWIKRIDVTASAQLLDSMPSNKAAILLERIESSDAQELMSHMKPERLFYVRKIMGKPGDQAPADEG
jgi:flagellar motility protein MotE (MotC chaperone)